MNVDPKELRGIGIQITKLEPVSGEAGKREMEQRTLGFRPVEEGKKVSTLNWAAREDKGKLKAIGPVVSVQPPSSDVDVNAEMKPPITPMNTSKTETGVDLPSFSQVDRNVLSELPEDVRNELTEEYSRRSRSATPAASTSNHLVFPQGGDIASPQVTTDTSANDLPGKKLPTPGGSMRKLTDRGTPLSRITQALAPRNSSSISPYKSRLFSKRVVAGEGSEDASSSGAPRVGGVKVTDSELVKLGLDVDVFRALPGELQSEQLARARFSKSFGEKGKKKA